MLQVIWILLLVGIEKLIELILADLLDQSSKLGDEYKEKYKNFISSFDKIKIESSASIQ